MIDKFEGVHRFLSNFWPLPIKFEGINYPSVEHAYQAAKFTDEEKREKIRTNLDPKVAKRIGRTKGMREDWDKVKLPIMFELVSIKFSDAQMAAKLLATGEEELIEGNWWGDTYWGICKGKGENHLGKILMVVRTKLKTRHKGDS